jgi:hypothetical protein
MLFRKKTPADHARALNKYRQNARQALQHHIPAVALAESKKVSRAANAYARRHRLPKEWAAPVEMSRQRYESSLAAPRPVRNIRTKLLAERLASLPRPPPPNPMNAFTWRMRKL